MDRRQNLTQFILYPETHPAERDDAGRYFGPRRLPGTTAIGLRKSRPDLFQDTLDSEFLGYADWLRRALGRSLRLAVAEQRSRNRSEPTGREMKGILRTAGDILEYPTEDGTPLHDAIPQQMYEDVFMRMIGMLLHPETPRREIHLYQAFNALCHRLGLCLVDAMARRDIIGPRSTDISRLVRVAVLSGYVGINLKSSASAASALLNRNLLSIPKPWIGDLNAVRAVSVADLTAIAYELLDLAESPGRRFQLDSLESYYREVIDCGNPTLLVFFSDDYLESLIDFKRFEAMLERNSRLRVLFAPRAGRYGNDLAYEDVAGILREPPFHALSRHLADGRLYISSRGPRAGCLDPRNLSRFLIREIDVLGENRRIIFETKGCRNFEMLQGRLTVPWYASFNCNRALSIRTVGVDGPPVFLRIPPGLKAYDGFTTPRIGPSQSNGASGVRFARMTAQNLYQTLDTPIYRRLSRRTGDERELHRVLTRWCDAARATFFELMEALSIETSPKEARFEAIHRAILATDECEKILDEPLQTLIRRRLDGKP